jgi:alkanesulfonate monooxygenase SsuD/methylene tetrahydromethanopterin reductase-like flavin-dependent oxidoreductase (luciferase family)
MLIGGSGPNKTLPLTAKYAAEWNAGFGPIEKFKANTILLDQRIAEAGRKPSDIKRSVPTQVVFGKDDTDLRAKLQERGVSSTDELWARGFTPGTSSELIDRLRLWQEAGVERLLLQWLDLDDIASLEMIARDVLPHFHTN